MELITQWVNDHVIGITLAIILLSLFKAFMKHRTSYWKLRNIKYAPSNLYSQLYNAFSGKVHFSDGFQKTYQMHSEPYIGFYEYTNPAIMIKDLDLLNKIMIKDFDHFVNRRTIEIPENDKISRNFLTTIKGTQWKNVRSAVSPTFTSKKIKITSTLILETAKSLAKLLSIKANAGDEFNVKELYTLAATDVIAGSVFGLQSKCLEGNKSFSDQLVKVMDFKLWKFAIFTALPKLGKLFGLRFLDKKGSDFLMNIVDTAVKMRKDQNITADDFIQHLIDLSKSEDGLHEDVNEDEDAKLNHKVNIKEGNIYTYNLTTPSILPQTLSLPWNRYSLLEIIKKVRESQIKI